MKSALRYFVMVGIPIVGVFGILRLGKDLKPPISVGGVWNVEVRSPPAGALPCNNFGSNPRILTISQSGPHLSLEFDSPNETKLSGEINDEIIGARSQVGRTASGPEPVLQLQARVDRQPGFHVLEGVLTVSNCSPEAQLSFRAIREPKSDHARQGR
jgi:hypothetical protein